MPSFALGTAALAVAAALTAALLILPIKAWMNQRESLKTSRAELEQLDRANAELRADVDRLQTRGGIAQAAREELGMIRRSETAYRVLALPELTVTFPDLWLYPALRTLITERIAAVGEDLPGSAVDETGAGNPTSEPTVASTRP